jgi:biopolymer transport protein ExbD
MAMNLGGGGGIKSDINVTPLVDVMLVLLIIMMIVAPLLQQGVPVTLPLAANSSEKPETQDQTVVTIDRNKDVYLNGKAVAAGQMETRIKEILEDKSDKIVIIKADEDVEYGAGDGSDGHAARRGIEDMVLITEDAALRPPRREHSNAAHQHFGARTVFKAEMPKANADMNITPMIDVLLVLLVIFMAALPLLKRVWT